jgi:hypothetical protein
MFRVGHLLAMWMIEECAKIAPVHVPVIPGNHDETAAFTMGVVLEAEFRRDKRVTFDNGPAPRKYYRYGKTLLGYAHGNNEKTQTPATDGRWSGPIGLGGSPPVGSFTSATFTRAGSRSR